VLTKVKTDPRSTSGSGPTREFNQFYRSPLAHACHVWSTSVNAFISYPAHRQNEWQTEWWNERSDQITLPAFAE